MTRAAVLATLLSLLLGTLTLAQRETVPGEDPAAEAVATEDAATEGAESEGAESEGAATEATETESEANEEPVPEEPVPEEPGAETPAAEQALIPLSSLRVSRGDDPIYVHQYAPSEAGGRTILRNPGCEEGSRVSIVYSPEPYLVETLVGEMRITSRLVLEQQPQEGEARAQLEMVDATLDIDERRCPQNVTPTGEAGVTLVEGRSTVKGTHLRYDNATGIGTLAGPVTLEREPEGESEALSAQADSMEFNVDEDRTLLRGGVTVESGGRVSEADEFEYDEAANLAVLRGSAETPATSREGTDVVSGQLIEYDLTTNDVVVRGGARGTIQFNR